MKTVLLIDGENFKNYLKFSLEQKDDVVWHKYDFRGLFNLVLDGYDIDQIIFYFAKLKLHEDTKEKSLKLIEEQRLLKTHLEKQGFKVVFAGRVRGYEENGFLGKKILVFKEKGVDVKIGVDMVSFSCDKLFNQIILGSSDSDLQPAINESKKRDSKIIYLGFENNPNRGISFNSDKTILIRNSEIRRFLSNQKYKVRLIKGSFKSHKLIERLNPKILEILNDELVSINEVIVDLFEIRELQKEMTRHYSNVNVPWYMDGVDVENNNIIVAFGSDDGEGGKIFQFLKNDEDKINEVIEYGLSKGIPKEQMDFMDNY